jgi:hypothetical protein
VIEKDFLCVPVPGNELQVGVQDDRRAGDSVEQGRFLFLFLVPHPVDTLLRGDILDDEEKRRYRAVRLPDRVYRYFPDLRVVLERRALAALQDLVGLYAQVFPKDGYLEFFDDQLPDLPADKLLRGFAESRAEEGVGAEDEPVGAYQERRIRKRFQQLAHRHIVGAPRFYRFAHGHRLMTAAGCAGRYSVAQATFFRGKT